jgi:hypothetical protein
MRHLHPRTWRAMRHIFLQSEATRAPRLSVLVDEPKESVEVRLLHCSDNTPDAAPPQSAVAGHHEHRESGRVGTELQPLKELLATIGHIFQSSTMRQG